ncbi:hypothetical protein HPG69_009213 [Diceros bicornis minor]|uniref:Uncharacterized protein n=1 Tax=Diceros bicornis minor TaxID=77932 RepID=A0A7J7EZV9_DICBM|nr:hypothetical protein HPG69_009213 [Diceros bicornis minor]
MALSRPLGSDGMRPEAMIFSPDGLPGPGHTAREMLDTQGSLVIRSVMAHDSGSSTVVAGNQPGTQERDGADTCQGGWLPSTRAPAALDPQWGAPRDRGGADHPEVVLGTPGPLCVRGQEQPGTVFLRACDRLAAA